jgi:4-amino-4-deoxy-L-arabinose transferase-like glycosyltransferase
MDRRKTIALLFVCYGLVALFRLMAPSGIDSRDQAKQGLYILDVVQKGSFFLPIERGSKPATKPPLFNWAAAAVSLAWGKVTDLTIKLPAVLSGLGVVLVTFLVSETLFSKEAGLFAGLVLILNYHFTNLSCTARTDMMLCFFSPFRSTFSSSRTGSMVKNRSILPSSSSPWVLAQSLRVQWHF